MNEWYELCLWDYTAGQVSDLVRDIQSTFGIDRDEFEFKFRPAWVNEQDLVVSQHRRSVVFRFRDPAIITWLKLKLT
jgi:hypothetical protein